MNIIEQGNNYEIAFNLYTDSKYAANNVIGELEYNHSWLELINVTISSPIGIRSGDTYLFGSLLPNKHYIVTCEFKILEENKDSNITWSVSTTTNETDLANNTVTVNLIEYLDGILASDLRLVFGEIFKDGKLLLYSRSVPYTGIELPEIPGETVGDTAIIKFTDADAIVYYRWDGNQWIRIFISSNVESRICLNTVTPPFIPLDTKNPTTQEVQTWANANLTTLQRTNGTQLVYYVDGDGGSCDNPDYIWTLNQGSELITLSNKRVFASKTVYVDAGSGSDVTGRRGYREFPFKTLDAAIAVLQDADELIHNSSGEIFSGTNIAPSLSNYYFDFEKDITLSGLRFIGTGLPAPSSGVAKNVSIKCDRTLTKTTNGSALVSCKGSVVINLNKFITSGYIANIDGGALIYINDIVSSHRNPIGFIGRESNSTVNVFVNNITISNPTSGLEWLGAFCGFINNLSPVLNNTFNCKVNNISLLTNYCVVFSINTTATNSLSDSYFDYSADRISQKSDFVAYPADPGSNTALINILDGIIPLVINTKIVANINNSDSDISVFYSGSTGAIFRNSIFKLNVNNSKVNKLSSFYFSTRAITYENSSLLISGNYINASANPIIYIRNLSLITNTTLEFIGSYKSNTNVSLSGLTIDTTSKIIFKGRYELGNGYFDISGVTGAGADNVYFEDCTIVTNNTECIVSGVSKNIKILNVRSNKPSSANIIELISSIIVNDNIN